MVIDKLKKTMDWMRELRAKRIILSNQLVNIEETAKISAFRYINLKDSCRLAIGKNTIIAGYLIAERDGVSFQIGDRCFIGGSRLIAASGIMIGDDVMISWGCTIVDHDSHSLSWSRRAMDVVDWGNGIKDWSYVHVSPVRIMNKVWIGMNVIILKGVTIGEGAVVGAGSVVTKDVDSWTVVAGNPARLIKEIPENER
jgi:acetyltransferase-like isoleucine patch superfamily enzyme